MGIAEGNPCVNHRFVIAEIENQLSILWRVLERKNERKKGIEKGHVQVLVLKTC
jgi:hypothetical protein